MPVTLRDVAERAGVSRSAVSRCFTPGASISDKTRAKVEKAAGDLGYSPNALASSLTTGRTKLVGVVSNNFHNPVFLEFFDLVTRELQARGLRPLLVNLSDETDPTQSMRMLQQYSVDAVIVASSTLPVSFATSYVEAGMRVVHSFGRLSDSPKIHVLGIDNVEAGRVAARELLRRGYRRVGFLAGPLSATSTRDRHTGFAEELGRHPDVSLSVSYAEAYTFHAGRAEMARLLSMGPAEAYFCGDDVLSIGALSAIRDAGLSVPQDVGILGLNNMEMAGWELIDLTTIHNPVDEIARGSVDLVAAMLDGEDIPTQSIAFACPVIERGTLRPVPD
ncbi:LacI family DNA-binding transcriptional regulator [uncultured Tateyamaria sp.]|uniref:LacI family DNA-binding transcriptional regulator n=1 Tax=uncultured Tateyamaria sp. TaxID=455651 RepID=UPI002628FB2A|nr:LacI family DNA-binding transcriptional regulator [uncultured Tateyamaria sp.]